MFAGCSGLGSDGDATTETITPAPVPTDRGAAQPLPPAGLTEDSITDVNRLASAHRRALRNESFVWLERRWIVVTEGGDVSRRVVETERTWVRNRTVYRHDVARRVSRGGNVTWNNRSAYAAGGDWQLRFTDVEGRSIVRGDPPATGAQFATAAARTVARYLTLQTTAVTALGGGRYRITGDGSNHPEYAFARNFSASATVSSSGLVGRLSASYTERRRDGRYRYRYESVIRDVGSATVPRPEWVTNSDEVAGNGTCPHAVRARSCG